VQNEPKFQKTRASPETIARYNTFIVQHQWHGPCRCD
jgi:hypothetical protein